MIANNTCRARSLRRAVGWQPCTCGAAFRTLRSRYLSRRWATLPRPDTHWRETMAQPPPFEIPQQLRELAERNVEQARAAYGQFMDAMMQATGMWANAIPANAMTSGFKTVQDRAVRFAKQNAEACFTLASELANAKDI